MARADGVDRGRVDEIQIALMALAILLGVMLALSALGMPLVFAILAASLAALFTVRPDTPLELVPQLFAGGIDNFPLLAIGFFFLAGELMNASGITDRILRFANALVGHIRGGLCQVGILTSMVFAGVSGSAVADGAAVGSVLIPSMKRAGYPGDFAAALVETASIMGPIIPPSIPMIIYAVLAEVSVGSMFIAGIVPGLLIAGGLALVSLVISHRRGYPKEPRAGMRVLAASARDAAFALASPAIILGGILGGVFTATEAGAIAAIYVLFLGSVVYRTLDARRIAKALVDSARGTASVLVILGASSIFAWIVADQKIGQQTARAVLEFSRDPAVVLLLINAVFFCAGLFLDPLAALVILAPIFLPVASAIGLDHVHFGLIVVLNLMIGLCTPPVGYLIYLTARIASVPPEGVIRESLPYIGVLVAVLLLVTYVPAVSLWLPWQLR